MQFKADFVEKLKKGRGLPLATYHEQDYEYEEFEETKEKVETLLKENT